MLEKIEATKKNFEAESKEIDSIDKLTSIRDKYLSRKRGLVSQLWKEFQSIPAEQKSEIGRHLGQLKADLEDRLEGKREELDRRLLSAGIASEKVDFTLPGNRGNLGHLHPITQVCDEIEEIFCSMGYSIEDGPEIETTYYNFEALNLPEHHPARDAQDTFYISDSLLLRTHTSPVQIRAMERQKPPLRIICPGRVYRRDNPDATHSPVFHQIEGLAVGDGITFRDFKGTLEYFLKEFFSEKTRVRFRPSYFGFTEPSAEVDISCIFCAGKGCRVCKMSGWVEVLGAGMVDPAVFASVNYDAEKYTGFAFGLGIERVAMFKYSIDNVQYFFENDLRFLEQF
jgi:phenylalanyl-tRNA synthetase alpha chain